MKWQPATPGKDKMSLMLLFLELNFKKIFGGSWVAQLVDRLTLSFGMGRNPRVMRLSPTSGSMLSVEPA